MSTATGNTLGKFKRQAGQCTWIGTPNPLVDMAVDLITGRGQGSNRPHTA